MAQKPNASPMTPFRPFCDGCGQRFEEGQLRPLSKFCTYCGEELSPWLRKVIVEGGAPVTPQITPLTITRRTEAERLEDPDATEPEIDGELNDMSLSFRNVPVRGRGRGRGRRRGRGGGLAELYSSGEEQEENHWETARPGQRRGGPRGRGATRGKRLSQLPTTVAEQGNFGRGQRNNGTRPDYSLRRMYASSLYSTPQKAKDELLNVSVIMRKSDYSPLQNESEQHLRR